MDYASLHQTPAKFSVEGVHIVQAPPVPTNCSHVSHNPTCLHAIMHSVNSKLALCAVIPSTYRQSVIGKAFGLLLTCTLLAIRIQIPGKRSSSCSSIPMATWDHAETLPIPDPPPSSSALNIYKQQGFFVKSWRIEQMQQ